MAIGSESSPGASSGDPRVFRFATEDFRKHERVAAWREVFGHTLLNIDIVPRSPDHFRASATVFRTPTLGVMRATTAPVDQGNRRSLVTNDDLIFSWNLSARWVMSKLRRNLELDPGDGVLSSNADVGGVVFPENCRYVGFRLPKSTLAPLVPDLGAMLVRRVPAANSALRMLRRYLDLAQADLLIAEPALQTAFTHHVCDLLALALGATKDAAELARTRGLPAARLHAMKDDIRRLCHQPDLSVHAIAARHKVSARYAQRVFEESGSTFTDYLSEQRLSEAYRALRHPASAAIPISTIAYDCGFSDVSHFNRLFRRRFGCTPSDVRKAARA
jgi:AraC-like DNA-binding protein